MPGSRDNRNSITDQLLNKLRAVISPMDTRQHSLDTSINKSLTVFSTDFHCTAHPVILGCHVATTHEGLSKQEFQPPNSLNIQLKTQKALLNAIHCSWQAHCKKMETKESLKTVPHSVQIIAAGLIQCKEKFAKRLSTRSHGLEAGDISFPNSYPIDPIRYDTKQQKFPFTQIRGKSKNFSKSFYCLPMIKRPIPGHRFPKELKNQFREVLAENAGTKPSNILINQIYDRINMSIFKTVTPDDSGRLTCYPKPEVIGKNRRLKKIQPTSYLVIGQTLDSKKPISALVPIDELSQNSEESQP